MSGMVQVINTTAKKCIFIGLILLATVFSVSSVSAQEIFTNAKQEACKGAALDDGGKCNDQAGTTLTETLANVIELLSVLVGIIAVIMIIVGGLRYVLSSGDSGRVGSAKNTIIFALIGLVFVALAQLIVRFVLNTATKG